MYVLVSIWFEFDKCFVVFVVLSLTRFAYVNNNNKRTKKVMSSTSNVYMN